MALSKALIKVYLYPDMKNSRKKVKLLFVLPALVSGGAERVLINLMNAADAEKYDRALLTVKNDGELGALVAADVALHRLGIRRFIFCLPALYKKLRELSPDIIVSTMTHMNFALLLLRPFFPRTRFLVREAITPSYFLEKYPLAGWLIKLLYRWLYPRADIVFSPSDAIFNEFDDLFGKDWLKSCVVRNPVAGDEIRAVAGGAFPSFADVIRFVACGRLVPQKGFDRLIETLAKISPSQEWHLTILGEGPQRPELESLIAVCELNDRIALPGLQANPYGYFAAADCLLLPSRFEGLPNVVLESLACGTPVIATRESGGIGEIAASLGADRKGAVTIVDDMAGFASAYGAVTAGRKRALAPSLLPSEYEKSIVLRRFEEILDDVQRP
jgi:glycosyltransferase involved in cell wall biosynthesis